MEIIRIHNCKTGEIIDRPRMADEQAEADAARAAAALSPPPVNKLDELKIRIAALEAKVP